jgi:hypothetical protein
MNCVMNSAFSFAPKKCEMEIQSKVSPIAVLIRFIFVPNFRPKFGQKKLT